jgi:hypothetical protein
MALNLRRFARAGGEISTIVAGSVFWGTPSSAPLASVSVKRRPLLTMLGSYSATEPTFVALSQYVSRPVASDLRAPRRDLLEWECLHHLSGSEGKVLCALTMSLMGQTQKMEGAAHTTALPSTADELVDTWHCRDVPEADVRMSTEHRCNRRDLSDPRI